VTPISREWLARDERSANGPLQFVPARLQPLPDLLHALHASKSMTFLRRFTGASGSSAHELVTDNLLAIAAADVVSNAQGGWVEKRHLIRGLSRLIF
jgi:hypothetical protein